VSETEYQESVIEHFRWFCGRLYISLTRSRIREKPEFGMRLSKTNSAARRLQNFPHLTQTLVWFSI